MLPGVMPVVGRTERETRRNNLSARGHRVPCSAPDTIADTLRPWFDGGATDGFNDGVAPILQERGLFRRAYGGRTLRGHLGLAWPVSQFLPETP